MSEEMDSPESWEFSRLPFASKILFVTLMCCFCSVPLNHSSVEECAKLFCPVPECQPPECTACVCGYTRGMWLSVGRECDDKGS